MKAPNRNLFSAIAGLAFLGALVVSGHCRIATVAEAEAATGERFRETAAGGAHVQTATLLVHSDRLGLHWKYAYGNVSGNNGLVPASVDQPFHIASIGKTFTSVLILQQVEAGRLHLDQPVVEILGRELLGGLFEYRGVDHRDRVTVEHLLTHTSGVADYFESTDDNADAPSVLQEMQRDRDRFWTPLDLLDFTRTKQRAVAAPGERFFYSDTGYILLGLIVEKLSGQSFEQALRARILKPLGMDHTYMHLRENPTPAAAPLSTVMLGDQDATRWRSVSCDWAGGGLVSTTEDLLRFHQALRSGRLISQATLRQLSGAHEFRDGIYYGRGYMTVRFGDMLFLMAGTPELYGHSGILATHMFYAPEYDAHIIANFGSSDDIGASFELLFRVMQALGDLHRDHKGDGEGDG